MENLKCWLFYVYWARLSYRKAWSHPPGLYGHLYMVIGVYQGRRPTGGLGDGPPKI